MNQVSDCIITQLVKSFKKVLSEIGIETMGQMERAPGVQQGGLASKEDDVTDADIEKILAGLKS